MLSLQINNKSIESVFKKKFNADEKRFIHFIEQSLTVLYRSLSFYVLFMFFIFNRSLKINRHF